ncbi:MAG TPA: M23 family metallopeptidase [Thermoanaerobaculia bacterium]|nr:M23 family metallopeptidase [Thermoanaerobaculia bacterium]
MPHVPAPAAGPGAPAVDVLPGGVVRWPGEAIGLCGDEHETWNPRDGACYYPVDLDRGEVLFPVFRDRAGKRETASVRVLPPPYATESLRVDPRTVRVSEKVRRRVERERRQVVPLFSLRTNPSFSLPLAPPLAEAPPPRNFGTRRLFNGEPRSAHGGVDYRAKVGTPVLATEGGLVVLAADHFFAGKNVFVDHGDGLLSMYMHLSRIDVKAGQRVARGERLGLSGRTSISASAGAALASTRTSSSATLRLSPRRSPRPRARDREPGPRIGVKESGSGLHKCINEAQP